MATADAHSPKHDSPEVRQLRQQIKNMEEKAARLEKTDKTQPAGFDTAEALERNARNLKDARARLKEITK